MATTGFTRYIHKKEKVLSQKQRLWSKKIHGVVKTYCNNSNLHLFAITGDLDNLGIFVSQHGRPLAENLVDIYNRLIGIFMYRFVEQHKDDFVAFCMIPSGEEMFAIGAAADTETIRKFFAQLDKEMDNFIQANTPFPSPDVTISFGCKIFPASVVRTKADNFIDLVEQGEISEASLVYYDLMLIMRQDLAYRLDRAKFESLRATELGLVVLFRNIVYTKLRLYKKETRQSLIALAKSVNDDKGLHSYLQSLPSNSRYGLFNMDIVEILESLSSTKNAE